MLKDFVRVANLQWCNVLSTNLIKSEIFGCWKSISTDFTPVIIFVTKYFEDLVKIVYYVKLSKIKYSLSEPNDLKRDFFTFRCLASP